MSSSLRRGALAAAVTAISILPLAACGAGNDASTTTVFPDNATVAVDDIKIQNVYLITQPEGSEGPASISARIFNTGDRPQTLESVAVAESGAEAELSPAEGSGRITVPANGSVLLGSEGNPSASLEENEVGARRGDVQPVVFSLSRAGEVKIDALVMPATRYLESYGPSALPDESPGTESPGTESPGTESPGTESPDTSTSPGEESPAGQEENAQEDAANGAGAGAGAGH